MKNISTIEIHYFEGKNHKVSEEYRVYENGCNYEAKYKSQLTKREKEFIKNGNAKQIFHF